MSFESSSLVSLNLWYVVFPISSGCSPIPNESIHIYLNPKKKIKLVVDIPIQGIHKIFVVLTISSGCLHIPTKSIHIDLDPKNKIKLVVDISIQGIHKISGFSNKYCMNTSSKTDVFKP